MKQVMSRVATLIANIIGSTILIIVGLVYFIIALSIVKFGSGMLGYQLTGNWAVFSASILVAGTMLSSALQNR